jgi:hypothetical protein
VDKVVWTGQLGQDRQVRTGHLGQDTWDRTTGTEQLILVGLDILDKTTRTEQPKLVGVDKSAWYVTWKEDSQDMTIFGTG